MSLQGALDLIGDAKRLIEVAEVAGIEWRIRKKALLLAASVIRAAIQEGAKGD